MDASRDSKGTTQQEKLTYSFSQYVDEAAKSELESSSESVFKETHPNVLLDDVDESADGDSTSRPGYSLPQGGTTCPAIDNVEAHVSDSKTRESAVESARNKPEPSVCIDVEKGSDELPFRATPLSNRDRLLLRKQALKMKKRPVLAVGRSNVISGVAKTIKTHFRKHPLAIVNIKGRAKGTSIQELVFKLEQATGAVLVSQEPSKVILYRGWGEGEEPGGSKKDGRDARKTPAGKEGRVQQAVSPQLMAAIRLECGLQSNLEEEATL
ncbi:hypothetical protein HHK36_015199 [Tetracentron sinense]|uniref:CRM domain-containing protein n=1 Tax=Tetracentron sinense TaxID=13715 RepID=A0A835DGI5_TETSI|nr:hypothetical protein HHK36_015199 [Tetracentron sinense]